MRVLAEYTITILKDGKQKKVTLAQGQKYKVFNKDDHKEVYKLPADILVGDSLGNYPIIAKRVPIVNSFEKGKKFDKIPVLNNLEPLADYMNQKYPDGVWDPEAEKETLKKYGVPVIRFLYMGLLIENIFGCTLYVPGRILKEGFFYEQMIDFKDIQNVELLEVE